MTQTNTDVLGPALAGRGAPLDREAAARDWGRAFIGLAALGNRRWRSYILALLRIVLYPTVFTVAVVAAPILQGRRPDLPMPMVVAMLGSMVAMGAAVVQTVARTHRRPWRSLISADLKIDWRRLAIGCGVETVLSIAMLLVDLFTGTGSRFPSLAIIGPIALAIPLIPLQAASEELLFRGYLTQELGRFIRNRVLLVTIVALIFAALHLNAYGPLTFPYMIAASVAFSLVTLRDGRLEVAIGAHTAMNWIAVCATDGLGLEHAPMRVEWTSLIVIVVHGAVFYGLTRLLVRRLGDDPGGRECATASVS